MIYKRISIAASLAVLLLIPFLLHQKKEIKPSKNNNVIALNIQKKKHKAPVLYTDNGQKIDLGNSSQSKTIKENNGVKVNLKGKKLTYEVNKSKTAIAYNTIKVPKSSEYFFKMNDGTKVWLNSDTKIKYPIPFHGDRREIYVEGEAYFEVAKNKHKPFIVNFPKGKIKVLGTKFNIKSYKDKAVEATLVSGSVYIEDNQKNSVVLKPSHQAIINNNKLKTRKVDPYMYICWKEGYFFYNNVELDIILNELSEWYDFEYIYKDKRISNIHLTAKIRRYDNFETIIDMLQRTGGIKFTKKNKMIIIDFE